MTVTNWKGLTEGTIPAFHISPNLFVFKEQSLIKYNVSLVYLNQRTVVSNFSHHVFLIYSMSKLQTASSLCSRMLDA